MHVLNQTLYTTSTIFASCSCGWYREYERFMSEEYEDDGWKSDWTNHFKFPPELTSVR